ncbi:hypothetical protein [Nannocystis punicea]|uniref:Uncharacterized protein n=1 Tax=Nannocystis punicea TaxID=2995304 RepID=A0ABY7H552_9BACT|nr:hypothetical protein [Nannocystis poenicansa]WAS94411.1 hypothetical protein O0S08_50485 [Nannocystis poenicansa]
MTRRTMFNRTCLLGHVLTCALACGRPGEQARPRPDAPEQPAPTEVKEAPPPEPTPAELAAEEARRAEAAAHRVVFADRITFGYVLLLPGPPGPAPTREELQAIVRRMFAESVDDPEVAQLLDLVATPPRADMSALRGPNEAVPKASHEEPLDPEAAARVWATTDLLGLEIEALPAAAVEPKLLADPELTRALEPEERASLPERTQLVLLRALYRNQNGVRGLRLLQALVRAVAADTGALVHDPDTLETVGPAAFAARRLQASLGNIADQVAVVPFIDPRQPDAVRLTTRGMRRFGSVDLELDGLERDLPALQQATYFLHGLGLVMVRLGEFDRSGFAVEAPDVIGLHYRDCVDAYAGQVALPRCSACPEEVEIHLVERPAEPHDPPGHVVARIVAPQAISGRPDYDHIAWIRAAIGRVLGRPAS